MYVGIIIAHPNPLSFNHALLKSFVDGAKTANHDVHIIDLYKDQFNPIISLDEMRGKISDPIVKKYQEQIKLADCLVFIYPIFWFRGPAILEGWIDRVFSPNFAFKYKTIIGYWGRSIGLLPCNKAIIINTYGSPAIATKYFYLNIPFRRLKRGVLKMCGVKNIIRINCWSVPFVSDEKRKRYLKKVFNVATRL